MLDTILATMRFGGGMWFPLIPFLFFLFWVGVVVFFGRRWRREPRRSGEEILAERPGRDHRRGVPGAPRGAAKEMSERGGPAAPLSPSKARSSAGTPLPGSDGCEAG